MTLPGLVLLWQQPDRAQGVIFVTLEDERDQANLVVWADLDA
ncbi:hypothetical protein [Teichococcus coralli]|nr:hypothetical protein [Pseudoroseomonas coralli]